METNEIVFAAIGCQATYGSRVASPVLRLIDYLHVLGTCEQRLWSRENGECLCRIAERNDTYLFLTLSWSLGQDRGGITEGR
jgi:hypothetical protein